MKILAFKGKGFVSRVIQLQTRSKHSHIAVQLDSGRIIEAWHIGGVQFFDPGDGSHNIDTPVDVYRVVSAYDKSKVLDFLLGKIGCPYDFRSIFRFLTRKKANENDRWFCSELAIEAFRAGGLDLLVGNSAHMSPRDVVMSPMLIYEGEIVL